MLPLGVVALGLVQGALAALNSVGIVLVWRATRVINLAQPALGLVGGVFTGLLVVSAGWSFWWAAPLGLVTGAILGLLSDRLVLARLQDAPRAVLLVVTVGLAQVLGGLQTALPFVFGGRLPSYSVDLGVSVDLFPVHLSGAHLLALLLLPLVWLPLRWFVRTNRLGLAALGLGQDAERARALGVDVRLVRSIVWSLAGALSAASGILAIPVLGFNLGGAPGPTVILLALAPAVLAGMRSLGGTIGAALAIGVAYQAALWWSPRAGIADLVLTATVIVAVLAQRRRWGRSEGAASISSWAAAATPRPLPIAVRRSPRFKVLAVATVLAAATLFALPPWLLGPSDTLMFATTAALVLTTLGVAAAWMFAGEVALGHWGLAGVGAAVALAVPAPWPVRVVVAAVVVAASGAVLAVASRAHHGRSFAVLGLAVAVAAPVLVALPDGLPSVDTTLAGSLTAVVAVAAVAALVRLRASTYGIRLVTARDEPLRAAWLGTDARRARVVALALSAAVAGLAGALYIAVVPVGAAPGAFDPRRSLDLLAMAVVGGLGSPVGVLLGASALFAGQVFLPGSWTLLASGVGVILVVMFLPAGLGYLVERVRDAVVRAVVGAETFPVPGPTRRADEDEPPPAPQLVLDERTHIAGSDTREVLDTPTVRAAGLAVLALAGPLWISVFGLPSAVSSFTGVEGDHLAWVAVAGLALTGVLVTVARRRGPRGDHPERRSFAGVPPAAAVAGVGVVAAIVSGEAVGLAAQVTMIVLLAWALGRAAWLAVAASADKVRSAALGVVAATALAGAVPAVHLLLVMAGGGAERMSLWVGGYAVIGTLYLLRAGRMLPQDRRRLVVRVVKDADEVTPPPQVAPALAARSVHVRFGGAEVLAGVDLDVAGGELVALVGGNGAGKSTLLRVAGGFERPAAGRVFVAGEDVTTLRPEERAVTGLAFVSGARPVFPDLTVLENLRVASYATHKTRRSFDAATEAILELVPVLRERSGRKAGVLSGGEQRLLAVAQTLYRRPVVLLADELSLGLDTSARLGVLDLLRRLANEGVAVVAVDHDLTQLLPRADRAVLLSGGRAREYRDPRAILEQRTDLLPATFLTGSAL